VEVVYLEEEMNIIEEWESEARKGRQQHLRVLDIKPDVMIVVTAV
jgi:hypothetical protein